MSCSSCHTNPCRCISCDAANEPLASALNNFITAFFGTVGKTCVNNQIQWVLPCDLDIGIPDFPRFAGEGLACYFLRYVVQQNSGPQGADGPQGQMGNTGPQGGPGIQGIQGIQGISGASGEESVSAKACFTSDQSIPDNANTVIDWNSEQFDTDDIHDNITNNSRLTCKTAGRYIVQGQISWAASATGRKEIFIRLNGVTDVAHYKERIDDGTDTSETSWMQVHALLNLNVNDYVELLVFQNSGVAVNAVSDCNTSWFGMTRHADSGPAGPQGIQGPQGPQGNDGLQGVQGLQGIEGAQGNQGVDGIDGVNGVNGVNGTNGSTGPQGPQGFTGASGAGGTPAKTAKAFNSTNQSIPDSTDMFLAFDSEEFDTDNIHDNAVLNSRMTVKTAGHYMLQGQISLASSTGGARVLKVVKNGIQLVAEFKDDGLTPATDHFMQVHGLQLSVVNDYYELVINQNSGAPVDAVGGAANTWFAITRVSDTGPAGPQGPQGFGGDDGKDGKNGTNGINGTNGKDGQDGEDGNNGIQGVQGIQGPEGPMGDCSNCPPSGGGSGYPGTVNVKVVDHVEYDEGSRTLRSFYQILGFTNGILTTIDSNGLVTPADITTAENC